MNSPRGGADPRRALLAWYIGAGADEAIGRGPRDRRGLVRATAPTANEPPLGATSAPPAGPGTGAPPSRPLRSPAPLPPDAAARGAAEIARACTDLASLAEAMRRFDGCALRDTATNLVFGDGTPSARIMFIGEAPGAEEDLQGKPFVGPAGRLLDRMLAAIGLDRGSAYITNIVPWRPPGNRKPTPHEVAICLPFLRRHIELVAPRVLVLVGGTSAAALLGGGDGITRLRGRWQVYRGEFGTGGAANPGIPTMPIFHSAFLLREPGSKKETWRDLRDIRRRLAAEGARVG